jgi:hypothetical protein
MNDTISARLHPITLPDAGGGLLNLGTLWEQQPAVVVFLRHWG